MVTLVQLVARDGTPVAEGRPGADGHVDWTGDASHPPVGGFPHIHILEEDTDATHP